MIPARTSEARGAGEPPPLLEGAAATSVLLVDDHPIVLQGCRRMVTNAGSAMRAKLKITSLAELIRFAIRNDPDRVA